MIRFIRLNIDHFDPGLMYLEGLLRQNFITAATLGLRASAVRLVRTQDKRV